jgi:hypothetical protein
MIVYTLSRAPSIATPNIAPNTVMVITIARML